MPRKATLTRPQMPSSTTLLARFEEKRTRRPKEPKLPVIAEKDVQASIVDYLRIRGYLVIRQNTGLAFAKKNNQYDASERPRRIEQAPSGTPDLLVIADDGMVAWVEVKRSDGGVLSGTQKAMHKRLCDMGHTVIVASSVDDVINGGL